MVTQDYPLQRYHLKLRGRQLDLRGISPSAQLIDSTAPQQQQSEAAQLTRAQLWPATVMLAEFVLKDEAGKDRPALEIGCGLGLVSMAAALAGWSVVATDPLEECVRLTEDNAHYNAIQFNRLECFDWTKDTMNQRFDRIFGADLLHHRSLHKPIIELLSNLLADQGAALLSDPNRATSDAFFMLCYQEGFDVHIMHVQTSLPDGHTTAGRIGKIKKNLP